MVVVVDVCDVVMTFPFAVKDKILFAIFLFLQDTLFTSVALSPQPYIPGQNSARSRDFAAALLPRNPHMPDVDLDDDAFEEHVQAETAARNAGGSDKDGPSTRDAAVTAVENQSDAPPAKRRRAAVVSHSQKTGRRVQRAQEDADTIRECLLDFFHRGRGRAPEYIRKMKESLVTVLATSPKVDAKLLQRYLKCRRMGPRLENARARMDENLALEPKEVRDQWKWWDCPPRRRDAYGNDLCAEAEAFWRVSASKPPSVLPVAPVH